MFTELIHIVVNCTGVRYTNKSPRIIFVIEDFPMRKIKVFSRIYKSLLVLCRKDPFQYNIYFVIISITSSVLEWLFYKTNRRDICTLVDCKFSFDSNLKEIPNLFPASCVKKKLFITKILYVFLTMLFTLVSTQSHGQWGANGSELGVVLQEVFLQPSCTHS